MDILESLTSDFDHLRYLTIELAIADTAERDSLFRELTRVHDVSLKAQMAALDLAPSELADLEFAKRKLLERADVMEEVATSVARTTRPEMREAKMDLYAELILQRVHDCEHEILPSLYDRIDESTRARMGELYEKYKDVALDHAIHPHSA